MVLPLGPARFYGSGLPRPFIYNDVKFNPERVDPPMGVTAPFMAWANDAHWSMGGVCLKRKRMQGKIEGNVKKLRDEEEKETKIKNRDEKKKKEEEKKNKRRKTDKDAPPKSDLASGSPENKGTLESKSKSTFTPKDKGTLGSKSKSSFSPKDKGISSPTSPSASSLIDSPTVSKPTKRRVFKHTWSDEDEDEEGDLPLVVPESEKPSKKRSPRVRIRVRKLGDVFNLHATDGSDTPSGQGIESHKVPSVAMQATKRQAGKIIGVYDYVAVPDRVMKEIPKRASPRKTPAKSPAFKVPSPVDSVRRSSRLSLTPPAAFR